MRVVIISAFYFAFLCMVSCKSSNALSSVNCRINDGNIGVVKIVIPKYKKEQIIEAGGEGIEYDFEYRDSSFFYVSSFRNGGVLNYDNVRNQSNAYAEYLFSDSITLQGKDVAGKNWKVIKRSGFYVGYVNANDLNKKTFDKAIRSIKIENTQNSLY